MLSAECRLTHLYSSIQIVDIKRDLQLAKSRGSHVTKITTVITDKLSLPTK